MTKKKLLNNLKLCYFFAGLFKAGMSFDNIATWNGIPKKWAEDAVRKAMNDINKKEK